MLLCRYLGAHPRRQGECGEECWKETSTWGDEEDMKASTFFHLRKVIVETHGLSSYRALEKTLVPQCQKRKQHKCPSAGEWTYKMLQSCNGILSGLKSKEGNTIHSLALMILEKITGSEKIQ